MTLPEELCVATRDAIVARYGLMPALDRDLTSPMSPTPIGKLAVWSGVETVRKVVYCSMAVPQIGLDSHMVFAFTAPESAVPHFTLDSVEGQGSFAFHLDLIPRVDLGVSLSYLDGVYEPLTPLYQEVIAREGLTRANLTPRQYAIMSPWMLVHRATAEAFAGIGDAVGAYREHWSALVESGVKSDLDGAALAQRDHIHRSLLFSVEIDPVWKQTTRLLGEEQSEAVRAQLLHNGVS
jgi:hypothetical protein